MNIHELIRGGKREDAMADNFGADANEASKKAHKSEDDKDHHEAAFLHAKAADAQSKKGNFNMAQHHQAMAQHHREECSPDSEEEE